MSSNNSTDIAASSQAPASSAPVSVASSSNAPASSAPASSSAAPQASSSKAPAATSVITASAAPPSTQVITSVVTPSQTNPTVTPTPSVVIVTSVITPSEGSQGNTASAASGKTASSTSAASLQTSGSSASSDKGLSPGGKTAIAVVIPVVVVALLLVGGIFLWRRRKNKKNSEDERRKEVEEYGYNPNNDPTLPAVGIAGSEMAEDSSGYRGWGNTTNPSNRKASTTLTSGFTGYSDNGSQPGGYHSPGSPTQGTHSDGQSNDPLVHGHDSDGVGALGAAPAAGQNRSDIRRGPSNASSSYSAANRSDNSGEYPLPNNNPQDYYGNEGNYYHQSPYGDAYGGGQQPIIRDVTARRNTRIENPSVFPQQGNSGIAQNF